MRTAVPYAPPLKWGAAMTKVDWHAATARRWRLYLEQDGLCFYCERPMTFHRCHRDDPAGHRVTLDHLTPLSQGGEHGFHNEVAACSRCNQRRGVTCWREFKAIVDTERKSAMEDTP